MGGGQRGGSGAAGGRRNRTAEQRGDWEERAERGRGEAAPKPDTTEARLREQAEERPAPLRTQSERTAPERRDQMTWVKDTLGVNGNQTKTAENVKIRRTGNTEIARAKKCGKHIEGRQRDN